ncbi:hypothetical protein QJS10_CPA02g00793 [Acorus calamus]|uniref:Uncharacterized protein n=1 Tax=Acorus calamus TaxID=4465 RepID=A0AAV9FB94_ACOCL|nr:hypothetical protein QJS10_CPA02g00793 [Acorus calamus]
MLIIKVMARRSNIRICIRTPPWHPPPERQGSPNSMEVLCHSRHLQHKQCLLLYRHDNGSHNSNSPRNSNTSSSSSSLQAHLNPLHHSNSF